MTRTSHVRHGRLGPRARFVAPANRLDSAKAPYVPLFTRLAGRQVDLGGCQGTLEVPADLGAGAVDAFPPPSLRAVNSKPASYDPIEHPSEGVPDVKRVGLRSGSFDALSAVDYARPFPPHFHDTFAMGVVESGATRLRTQRGAWIARAGSILAFAPGEIHSAIALGENGYTYRMIYPSVEFMREIGRSLRAIDHGRLMFRTPVIDDPALGFELARSFTPLMDGSASAVAESRFVSAMRKLVSRYATDTRTGAPDRAADLVVVDQVRDYLQTRFSEHVRLTALAEMCGIGSFQLIRIFRRVVGVPPYAYLVQLRVNRAQAMLYQGAAVADVAYACGFSDQSHLTRTFKKAIGVPPGRYARSVHRAAA
jgi:AraC-like DNA-binding protein